MHTIPPQGIESARSTSEGTAATPYDKSGEEGHERFVDPEVVLIPLLDLVLRSGDTAMNI